MAMRLQFLLGLMLGLVNLLPGRAYAQTHVCGAGPGPGEVQVGVQPGGNGVAPTPLCNWTQKPSQAPPRNRYMQGDPDAPSTLPRGWTASVKDHDKPMAMSFAKGMPSRAAAIEAAMADCRSKGATSCDLIAAVRAR